MRFEITEPPLPENALLRRFVDSGDYTDCFMAHLSTDVTFPAYIEAFYTTAVFKTERFILKWLVSRPSTDEEARALANDQRREFAAWRMLDRTENQLLMMDFRGQTCSWFLLGPAADGCNLYFGSAVIRNRKTASGRRLGGVHGLLLGFHRVYSRVLLRAACKRLAESNPSG